MRPIQLIVRTYFMYLLQFPSTRLDRIINTRKYQCAWSWAVVVQLSSRLSSQVGLLLSAEAGVLSPTPIAIAIARLRQSVRVGETLINRINRPMTTTASQLMNMDRRLVIVVVGLICRLIRRMSSLYDRRWQETKKDLDVATYLTSWIDPDSAYSVPHSVLYRLTTLPALVGRCY